MYADKITDSMKVAIEETSRRREIQEKYNEEHGIVPTTIVKEIHDIITNDEEGNTVKVIEDKEKPNVELLEQEMKEAAKQLDFERAMELRDIIFELKSLQN